MKDFDALKDIWTRQASVPKLNSADVLKQVKKNKAGYSKKLLFESLVMMAVVLLLVGLWVFKSFVLWTSHLSIFILILSCTYYMFIQFRDYKSIQNNNSFLEQPEKYIAYLKSYKRSRYNLNTRTFSAYSIAIGIAFALYFVEVFIAAPLWQTIAAVGFTIAWFVFSWVLMQSYKKREQERLQELIVNLENLERQFEG
ncbi:hypothetical protein [Desertivirga brevis]|uniref:hypothetical protein n=1 Tax=Desertivirga brevis TaxID=2810310 RepID=UPI001A97ACFA|nr:hypothetical protein [Pedobacter sp. SYSU D00873]